jgi:hypothetical protein
VQIDWRSYRGVICSVNISNSVTIICSYGLYVVNKSNYQSELRLESLWHVTVCMSLHCWTSWVCFTLSFNLVSETFFCNNEFTIIKFCFTLSSHIKTTYFLTSHDKSYKITFALRLDRGPQHMTTLWDSLCILHHLRWKGKIWCKKWRNENGVWFRNISVPKHTLLLFPFLIRLVSLFLHLTCFPILLLFGGNLDLVSI